MEATELKYLLVFALSLILSLILVPVAIRMAKRLDMLDHPEKDRWHDRVVPNVGGVAIFISFMLTSVIFVPFQREIWIILSGAVAVFTLGFLDDRFGTHPRIKLIVQFGVALALIFLGVRLRILPAVVAIPVTLLWIVGLINALNMIDNMDGLSGGITFIASMMIFLLSWQRGHSIVPVLALALAGGCLGFLVYNFNPARVFMGDCGSLFLGYTLSVLAILGFWQKSSPVFPLLAAPVLILGYAVFDTILVTVLRLKARGRPWIGGKDHSSHRLARLGLGERGAVLFLYALVIMVGISAFVVLNTGLAIGVPLVVFLSIAAVIFGWFLWKRTEELIDR